MTDSDPTAQSASRPIVEASDLRVTVAGTRTRLHVDIAVRPGELHLIHARQPTFSTAIADALIGVDAHPSAAVRFCGAPWDDLSTDEACQQRRRVGRVRAVGNWMDSRPLIRDMLLPLQHHTVISERQLRTQAGALARHFGLPGLPIQPPGDCTPQDLERAACVRAFLGRPLLVVLEHPMAFADGGLLGPLVAAIRQVHRRGGAVIWFTEHESQVADDSLPAGHRYHMVGGRLLPVG